MPSAMAAAMPADAAPQTDLTVTLPDGRRMAYAEYGDPHGVPLIGLHGTPGSRLMFRIADASARRLHIRLLTPERPGFGITCYQRGRGLASYAQDIGHFADALGLTRFALAGVSGGGPYATACAAFLGDRVSALALISPVGPIAGPDAPAGIGIGHAAAFRYAPRLPSLLAGIFGVGRLAFLYAPSAMFGFILSRAAPSDWPILSRPEVRDNLIAGVAEGCRPGMRASLQEMRLFSRPWNVPFGRIACPAFLWQGLGDRNVPVAAALRLGELIPKCHITAIEKAGHYWIFDNIDAVLETILRAVKAQPSEAA